MLFFTKVFINPVHHLSLFQIQKRISLLNPGYYFLKKHFGLGIIEGKGLLEGHLMY